MSEITPQIMYTIGQIVSVVYGDDIPSNVKNYLLRFPMRGIGFMANSGALLKNQNEIARLIDKLPADLKDPKDGLNFDCQGAFWFGYYHYQKLSHDVKNYTANDLTTIGKTLYGEQWQTNLAKDLELSSPRRVRAWLTGERPIPFGVWADLADLLRKKQTNINTLLSKMESLKNEEPNKLG